MYCSDNKFHADLRCIYFFSPPHCSYTCTIDMVYIEKSRYALDCRTESHSG